MKDTLVSIIINNYNYADYLQEAINSALNQTYPYKEIIVVDDGSTDHSRQIIESYKERIIPIFKKNGGQASAMNEGIRVAKGEMIAFLDADDLWFPNKIERTVSTVENYENWSFLRHDLNFLLNGNEKSNQTILNLPYGLKSNRIYLENILIDRLNAPTSAMVVHKNALAQMGEIPEEDFRISADAYLYTHLPKYGEVITLGSSLGLYRIHGNNHYFGANKSLEGIEKTMKLELALIKSLPDVVRYSDYALKLAHQMKTENGDYLSQLGTLVQRLKRIIGNQPLSLARKKVIKTVVKELLRSINSPGKKVMG